MDARVRDRYVANRGWEMKIRPEKAGRGGRGGEGSLCGFIFEFNGQLIVFQFERDGPRSRDTTLVASASVTTESATTE